MKKNLVIIFVVLLSLILLGCTSKTAGTENNNGSSAKGEGKDDLVIGYVEDAVTLLANTDVNSYTSMIIRNIYDPLLERDGQTGDIIPAIAIEWENIDETTWNFTLRDDIKFHNGNSLTAEDVKWNIDYVLEEDNNSAYRSRWTSIKEAKVIDDYTLEIITNTPFADLPARIADDLLIMDPKHIEEVGLEEAAENPIGSGPYTFDKWDREQEIILASNNQYWKDEPKIKKVTFKILPEYGARLSSLQNSEVDLITTVSADSVSGLESNDNLKVHTVSTVNILYAALSNFKSEPLKDQRVRQALNYAIDVDELLEGIANGYGQVMRGVFSTYNQDYTEVAGYEYDPDKAIELLKEAGYVPEDLNLKLEFSDTSNDIPQIAQAMAAQLEKIGITLELQNNEWGNHLERIRGREIDDMYLLGYTNIWTGQSSLESLFYDDAPYNSYLDEKVDQMITEVSSIMDVDEREQKMIEIQNYLDEQAPWIPLWQREEFYATAKDLNFNPRVDTRLQVFEMSWDN